MSQSFIASRPSLSIATLIAAFALAAMSTGCEEAKKADAKPDEAKPAAASAAASPGVNAATLASYEVVRVALAADDLAAAKTGAGVIAAAKYSEEITAAANAITGTEDIEVARKAFGQLSHATIGGVVAAEGLGKGLTTYRCPMAKGYKKWLQPDTTEMANPYMGKKMLKCGGKVELAV